jgi:hypothetical protein
MQAKPRKSGKFNHFVLTVERFLRNPRFIGIIPPVPILFIGDTPILKLIVEQSEIPISGQIGILPKPDKPEITNFK